MIWKGQVRGLAVQPADTGMEVIVTGTHHHLSRPRRKYQIVIETMEPAGVGALLAQLERLKAKLAAEGLFEAARKRPLPADAGGDRRDHQPHRRGDPRHPAPHPRPLALPGDRLAGGGAGRRRPPARSRAAIAGLQRA